MKTLIFILLFPLFLTAQNRLVSGGNYLTDGSNILTTPSYQNLQYISFGGTNEYLNYASVLSDLGTTHSITFWAKCNKSISNNILGTATATVNFLIHHTDNKFYYGDNNEYKSVILATRDNTWQFYCFTRKETSLKFYMNEVQIGVTQTLATSGSFSPQFIGSYSTLYSTASIDELTIYNKVISSGEMTILYGGGTPQTCGNPQSIEGLLHYMNFEQTITTITDIITSEVLTQNNMEAEDIVAY